MSFSFKIAKFDDLIDQIINLKNKVIDMKVHSVLTIEKASFPININLINTKSSSQQSNDAC